MNSHLIHRYVLSMFSTGLVLVAVAMPMTSAEEGKPVGLARADVRLAVVVECAMPVRGQPCRLWLTDDGKTNSLKSDDVDAKFYVAWNGEKPSPLDLPVVRAGDSLASVRWKPQQTGPCRISAKTKYRDGDGTTQQIETSSVEVFVTSRKLHFNYWQARLEQRRVTSVMDNSKTTKAAIQWKRRGVLPLGYKSGQWHWAHGYDSAEKIARLWTELPEERGGIVIDEFGGGDEIDQQLGDALRLTRKQRPTVFIAPYCLSVSGQKMIDGYRQADLILVETYTPDWRWDGFITGRWKTAVDAGLKTKSIAVLGLGSQWIGTERELRRVFRMVRATCPEMPGVGFFPDIPPRLMKAVDSAIEDYFLGPVVEVRVDSDKFTVRNIGETQAADVEVKFLDRHGKRVSKSKVIPRLRPWSNLSGDLPPAAASAEIVAAPDRYTALAYTPPLEQQKLNTDQQRASREFRKRALSGNATNPLKEIKELTLVRDDNNNMRSVSIPIRASGGKAVALSFDVRPDRCWFYGHNSVSLVGDGELTLTWSRQDHDAGIEGNQPRPAIIFKGKDKYVVRDVPTMGFRENETFRVLLAYDGREAVRAVVASQKNTVLWDSGSLPANGGFSCSKLRFDVNPFKRSEISVNAKNSEILLRGGGGDADSPYWLESTLSNLSLVIQE